MPRSVATSIENNFVGGLITEATGLNFPENACTETFDCDFDDSGRVTRRSSFEYEQGYVETALVVGSEAVVEFEWKAVAGDGATNIVVQQIGDTLHYFQTDSTGNLSAHKKPFTTSLSTFQTSGSPDVTQDICQFATGNGYLFVVHPHCRPFYVEYDLEADTITETSITLKVRDLKGLDETTDIDNRPSTLSTTHKYNLFNQGWYIKADVTGGAGVTNVLDFWDSRRSDFPSNADIWWTYKNSNEKVDNDNFDRFKFGNSPAPKGHYIFEAFNKDRSALSGISGLEVESSSYHRPKAVAFFAGRVWYASVGEQNYNTTIWFSQILEDINQVGRCYQLNDPTAEEFNDLLDTDGGTVVIPEISQVIKLFPLQGALLVFATNGVWVLKGNEGTGFRATDYSVSKISSFSCLSPLSFVDVGGAPMWWNNDNIFTVQSSSELGNLTVIPVTDSTIKKFITDIPSTSKKSVKGAFNPTTNRVVWLYRSTEPTTVKEDYTYDRCLVLNTQTGSFSPWTISNSGPKVKGILNIEGTGSEVTSSSVIDGTDNVIDGTNQVISTSVTVSIFPSVFKFFTSVSDTTITYSDFQSGNLVDWILFDGTGVEYTSYGISGYKIRGEGIRKFQDNYTFVFMEEVADSSMFIQLYWGYANDQSSSRFSTEQQAYRPRTGFGHSRVKLKTRGKGEALQVKFRSEGDKPFTFIGWSAFETINNAP